jgi:hypothetical protein
MGDDVGIGVCSAFDIGIGDDFRTIMLINSIGQYQLLLNDYFTWPKGQGFLVNAGLVASLQNSREISEGKIPTKYYTMVVEFLGWIFVSLFDLNAF